MFHRACNREDPFQGAYKGGYEAMQEKRLVAGVRKEKMRKKKRELTLLCVHKLDTVNDSSNLLVVSICTDNECGLVNTIHASKRFE